MRKFLVLILLLSFCWTVAQDPGVKISLSFEESGVKEVLDQIEEITDYRFYYVEEWLGNKNISGSAHSRQW